MKNTTNIMIEYPARHVTYTRNEYGVFEYGVYPRTSVLRGRVRRVYLDSFDTLEAAREAYPNAAVDWSAETHDREQNRVG